MNKLICCAFAIGVFLSPFAHSQTLKINNLTIEIVEGDITLQQADAIIVPHFRDTISLTGAGEALSRKGGNDALESAKQILQESHLQFGQAFLTSTKFLRAKVLNVVTIGVEPRREAMTVEIAVANALAIAGGSEFKSVAVSALGVENAGTLSGRESAHAIFSAIRAYAKRGGHVEKVRIAIYQNPDIYQTFVRVLNELSNTVGFCDDDLAFEDKVSRR